MARPTVTPELVLDAFDLEGLLSFSDSEIHRGADHEADGHVVRTYEVTSHIRLENGEGEIYARIYQNGGPPLVAYAQVLLHGPGYKGATETIRLKVTAIEDESRFDWEYVDWERFNKNPIQSFYRQDFHERLHLMKGEKDGPDRAFFMHRR
ncbi:hypothetical protein GOV11_04440 [Candidatus Woesearchaeota archaeon]|nr:hypothetical protein [Candidatus Woesearchaeota archaeon]